VSGARGGRDDDYRVAFLYSGALRGRMLGGALELYESQSTFRRTFDRCAEMLGDKLDESIVTALKSSNAPLVERPLYRQVVLFAIELALTEAWKSWGIVPSLVVGYGAGEVAAATAAGSLSIEDGLRLSVLRGRLLEQAAPASELVALIGASEASREGLARYADSATIAAFNAPDEIVACVTADMFGSFLAECERRQIRTVALDGRGICRWPDADDWFGELEHEVSTLRFDAPHTLLISGQTGAMAGPEL